MKIYIAAGRFGCNIETPKVFKSYSEAHKWCRKQIAKFIQDEADDEDMPDLNLIDENDVDIILDWAEAEGYCSDPEDNSISTTFGDDWLEYTIFEEEI